METMKLKNMGYVNVVYCCAKLFFAMLTCIELFYFAAFLTDAAIIATAIVAIILSVTSTVDFIASFFLGVILELVHMPWGKYRSWLLIAPPIVTVFVMLMFSKIGSNDTVAAVIIIVGFIVSHIFWSVAESAWNAMPLVMTEDQDQRTSLSIWGGRGSMANTLAFGVMAVPLITGFNNLTSSSVWGYTLFALVLCVLYWIGFWWLFFVTRDCADAPRKGEKFQRPESHLGASIKAAISNPNLLVTMLGVCATYCYGILQSGAMYYYFSYTLDAGVLLAFMGTYITIVSAVRVASSFLVPTFLKIFKGSKKAVYLMGFIGSAIMMLLAFALNLPAVPTLVILLIGNIFASCNYSLQLGLYLDCAVYSEYKAGKDVKGFVMSLMTLPIKLGITIKSYIISAVLVAIGYSATAADTSAYAANFNMLFLLIPVIICVIVSIVFGIVYRLPEVKVAEMQNEIEKRKGHA